ncbi:MAG: diguanylate cyclase [Candidatus Thiodiazotropha taylori]
MLSLSIEKNKRSSKKSRISELSISNIWDLTNFIFNRKISGIIFLGILYFLFGQIGLLIQSSQSGLTLIWPASGVAFAVLYLYRLHFWPGIVLGMLLLAIYNQIPFHVATLAAIGSVFEVIVGIYLLRKTFPNATIDRLNGLLAFTFFCVLVGPMFSASVGTYAFHTFLKPTTEPMVTWLYWWLGNSIGLITFGGSIIVYSTREGSHTYKVGFTERYQFPRLFLYFIVFSISLLNAAYPNDPMSMVLLFFALPAVALIGLSGGMVSAAHVNLIVVMVFILGGYVISTEHFLIDHIDHLYLHIAFIGVLSFTSLILAVFGKEISEKEIFHYKSSHDSLTGLTNRDFLYMQIEAALNTVSSRKQVHALLFIDLDDFKSINDSQGHAAGDRMLNEVSKSISQHIRSRDCAARWGGDEFAVLLWYCPFGHAKQIAELIRKDIADQVIEIEEHIYRVTASIGLVMLGDSIDTIEDALDRVDKACYDSKRKGGNTISVS